MGSFLHVEVLAALMEEASATHKERSVWWLQLQEPSSPSST